jgi:hypothetical protein
MRLEGRHRLAHLHLTYQDFAVSIAIRNQRVLAGSFPVKQLAEAAQWIAAHQEELLDMWTHRFEPGGIYRILD